MAKARIFVPENRLAKAVRSLNGPTSRELVMDAEIRVSTLRSGIQQFVDDQIGTLIGYASANNESLLADLQIIEHTAVTIAEVAGGADLNTIGAIAGGIVAMADATRSRQLWHPEALRVHLNALIAVRVGADGVPREAAAIIKELRAMREAIGVLE